MHQLRLTSQGMYQKVWSMLQIEIASYLGSDEPNLNNGSLTFGIKLGSVCAATG